MISLFVDELRKFGDVYSMIKTVLREWLGHRDITNTLSYTQILAHYSRVFKEQVQF